VKYRGIAPKHTVVCGAINSKIQDSLEEHQEAPHLVEEDACP